MRDYPQMIDHTGDVEPVPRRIRGYLGGRQLFDTVRAVYVWESVRYPQYYVPEADVDVSALIDENHVQRLRRGRARSLGLRVGEVTTPRAARVYGDDAGALAGLVRFEWDALDAWFEEDEQVFVHPRNPYTRVDALRSRRTVTVQLADVILAESSTTIMVFETGLPTRYYFDRSAVMPTMSARERPSSTSALPNGAELVR